MTPTSAPPAHPAALVYIEEREGGYRAGARLVDVHGVTVLDLEEPTDGEVAVLKLAADASDRLPRLAAERDRLIDVLATHVAARHALEAERNAWQRRAQNLEAALAVGMDAEARWRARYDAACAAWRRTAAANAELALAVSELLELVSDADALADAAASGDALRLGLVRHAYVHARGGVGALAGNEVGDAPH